MIGFSFAQPFLITAAITYVGRIQRGAIKMKDTGSLARPSRSTLGLRYEYCILGGAKSNDAQVSTVHHKRLFIRVITRFRGAMIVVRELKGPIVILAEHSLQSL